jgi:hypothetical protein
LVLGGVLCEKERRGDKQKGRERETSETMHILCDVLSRLLQEAMNENSSAL